MNLKYIKITLPYFIVLYISIVLFFSILSYYFFIYDFKKLEYKQNLNNINTILNSINTNIKNIKNITVDYSKWDDTYNFLNNNSPEYIYENFRDGTSILEDLNIDFMIFSTIGNKVLFSKYSDNPIEKNRVDFENEISKKLKPFDDVGTKIKYKSHSMYIIKSPVTKSDGEGKINGFIYTGKIITNDLLNSYTKVFNKLYMSNTNFAKNDIILTFAHLKDVNVKTILKSKTILNHIQIYDDNDNYMFTISTQNKRDIVNSGQKTIFIFNIVISLFLLIIFYFLYKTQKKLEKNIKSQSNTILENEKIIAKQHKMTEAQSKIAAMGEILENIAHHWRQPLSVISSASSGIKLNKELGLLSDELLIESVDNITNSAQYLSETINDFRNFYKKDKENVLFDLKDCMQKAISLFNPLFLEEKIELIKNIETAEIYGSNNELIQVFLNIFNNSIEAFGENKTEKKYITIESFNDGIYLVIKIKDNAGGIPTEAIEKVFEPYFTTKHQSQGKGIGLYMSYEIITKHMMGDIEVENSTYTLNNDDCKGVQVTIKLPLNTLDI